MYLSHVYIYAYIYRKEDVSHTLIHIHTHMMVSFAQNTSKAGTCIHYFLLDFQSVYLTHRVPERERERVRERERESKRECVCE